MLRYAPSDYEDMEVLKVALSRIRWWREWNVPVFCDVAQPPPDSSLTHAAEFLRVQGLGQNRTPRALFAWPAYTTFWVLTQTTTYVCLLSPSHSISNLFLLPRYNTSGLPHDAPSRCLPLLPRRLFPPTATMHARGATMCYRSKIYGR